MPTLRVLVPVLAVGVVCSKPLFAKNASKLFETDYWPHMKKLFIREGESKYPVPNRSGIADLLAGLRGTAGLAVHTAPDTTVTEGQGYAMFAAGMANDTEALKGLTVAWQGIGQGFESTPACGGCGVNQGLYFDAKTICTRKFKTPCLCKTVKGAYMPGWLSPFTNPGSMGSATDGDEDAVTGLIYLAELTGLEEFRKYAVHSIVAFVLEDLGLADPEKNSRPVPAKGDIPEALQTMYLWRGGSCWGGYDTSSPDLPEDRNLCINPAYFSPGEWRLFKEYIKEYPTLVPAPHTASEIVRVLDSAIVWGYNTINRIACPSGVVSNWWTVPDKGWPWDGELKCKNSGTESGAHYSDAARIPWRVALDYIWFSDGATAPLYDEHGKHIGQWGAKEYSNRWVRAWTKLIARKNPKGSYPPLDPEVLELRKDQVLPLLSDVETCKTCPKGFTAPPWNAWGSYAVATAFQVPLEDFNSTVMQQWTEFIAKHSGDGCSTGQYFDLGQQVIVSQMLGGRAWWPLPGRRPGQAPTHMLYANDSPSRLESGRRWSAGAATAALALGSAALLAAAVLVRGWRAPMSARAWLSRHVAMDTAAGLSEALD